MGNDFEGVLFGGLDGDEEDGAELTISGAAELKFELEGNILDLLEEFEKATQLSVATVSFDGEDVIVIAVL
jgi:hypothetical protein